MRQMALNAGTGPVLAGNTVHALCWGATCLQSRAPLPGYKYKFRTQALSRTSQLRQVAESEKPSLDILTPKESVVFVIYPYVRAMHVSR